MTTPQSIREKSFDKVVFGGYDPGAVEDYLDSLATELEALQKEGASLRAKMKVLVAQIEKYRLDESTLNQAIISAQKLGVQIEEDARTRAASTIAEAETKAAVTVGGISERAAQEEARLQAAKLSSAKFFDSIKALCQKQLENLEAIENASFGAKYNVGDAARIQVENIAPKAETDPLENDNTQVFMFSKDN